MPHNPTRMLENYLETAICMAFPLLLPDLHAAGYRIKSQQANLQRRRLDLLLETASGDSCIIELKSGSPPMPQVRDQILDYAKCWQASYPERRSPRLIVIGNSIPSATKLSLESSGVESRAITHSEVLSALEQCLPHGNITSGLKLIPDNDPAKVRHLISDYLAVTPPKDLPLQRPWSHEKVFFKLIENGQGYKDPALKNPYVYLYTQKPNCAVLYHPKVESTKRGPLHLNHSRIDPLWKNRFEKMQPLIIEKVQQDSKGKSPAQKRNNFDWSRSTTGTVSPWRSVYEPRSTTWNYQLHQDL